MLNTVIWTVNPTAFSIGPVEVRWYGLLFALGFLIGYYIEAKIFKHDKAPDDWCDKLFVYTIIATIIGALPVLRMGLFLGSPARDTESVGRGIGQPRRCNWHNNSYLYLYEEGYAPRHVMGARPSCYSHRSRGGNDKDGQFDESRNLRRQYQLAVGVHLH